MPANVLVSVADKTGLATFCAHLASAPTNASILCTGGTAQHLREHHCPHVKELGTAAVLPDAQPLLGGRVKTLRPEIHAGLLATPDDEEELTQRGYFRISTLIVNLYPFKETIKDPSHTRADAIASFDIGGHAMIRAACKNADHVRVYVDPSDYGNSTMSNYQLAAKALAYVTDCDIAITEYFNPRLRYRQYSLVRELKYGNNPQQTPAAVWTRRDNPAAFEVLNGSPGYINCLDAQAAWSLVTEAAAALPDTVVAASFKHTAPAGVGTGTGTGPAAAQTAYTRARDADPLSSFGDFAAISHPVDCSTAALIKREVSDGIIAPGYTDDALAILTSKKGGRFIVLRGHLPADPAAPAKLPDPAAAAPAKLPDPEFRELGNLVLSQPRDTAPLTLDLFPETFPDQVRRDLLLANITLRYTPSNSIACAQDGQVIGVGAGQQNRVECVRLATDKAHMWQLRHTPPALALADELSKTRTRTETTNALIAMLRAQEETDPSPYPGLNTPTSPDAAGDRDYPTAAHELAWHRHSASHAVRASSQPRLVLASDAFFPFPDSIEVAAHRGVQFISQPGGSVRDGEVDAVCAEHGIQTVKTGIRLFTH